MREKIAVIAWGAMADVLYATPIVRQIRRMSPEAYIVWLVRDKFAPVVQGNQDIDEVRTFPLPEGFPDRQAAEHVMDKIILEYAKREEFSKFYDLQYWPRYSNFYENPNEDFVSLRARNAGIDPATITDRSVELRWSRDDEKQNTMWMMENGLFNGEQPFISVNHISYAADAVWSLDNYQQLADILWDKHQVKSVFTGAPNEPIPENVIDARGMPYRQWAIVIRASNLWLGLDSGAVALACASETPIIKLHSPGFPLAKTGIRSMGLRQNDVLELCPAPTPESLAHTITRMMSNAKS